MIENFAFNDLGNDLGNDLQPPEKSDRRDPPISQMMTKKKERPIEATESQGVGEAGRELENCRQSLVRLEAERKELQEKLNSLYNQMQLSNESLITLTNELQQERKNTAELRSQLKKTKKESELIVEVQSLNLHVEKLEKDMITSKVKYAEEADYVRDKYSREKVIWTQKLVQLTEQIARQDLQINSQKEVKKEVKTEEKKKKKGFFG
jgi:chromosome segregation ATPase